MRISDGSSDVCSSDLVRPPAVAVEGGTAVLLQYGTRDPDVARGADVPPAVGVGVCDIDVVDDDLLRRVRDRKSVVEGKSVSVRVDSGGRRNIKKKNIGTYTSSLI